MSRDISGRTVLRDIEDLLRRGILVKSSEGGRSTAYLLTEPESRITR
jgi:Fic family protein